MRTKDIVRQYYMNDVISFSMKTAVITREAAFTGTLVEDQMDEILNILHLPSDVCVVTSTYNSSKRSFIKKVYKKLNKYRWFSLLISIAKKLKRLLEKIPALRPLIRYVIRLLRK